MEENSLFVTEETKEEYDRKEKEWAWGAEQEKRKCKKNK